MLEVSATSLSQSLKVEGRSHVKLSGRLVALHAWGSEFGRWHNNNYNKILKALTMVTGEIAQQAGSHDMYAGG